MSIPLDRLYHYIESVAQEVQGDTIIYRFCSHGSKKIEDLTPINNVPEINYLMGPQIFCNDQEPLNFDLYQDYFSWGRAELNNDTTMPFFKHNLRKNIFNLYDQCVLMHSEKNSSEINKYENAGFIPVYYWCHALIALDWFRFARHIKKKKNYNNNCVDFLIYNRAWSGTREYRLKFADLLIEHNLVGNCKTSVKFNEDHGHYSTHIYKNELWKPTKKLEEHFIENTTTSCYSADFEIQDYQDTQCEVVLETLFDSPQLQLTEKILRPIALGHPFLLCGPVGSLKYLQDYGFKTFESIIDESYDSIHDPMDRLNAVLSTMKTMTNWSSAEKKIKFAKMQKIANFNKKYFFSKKFNKLIDLELRNNLTTGIQCLLESNTFDRCINLNQHARNNSIFMAWQSSNMDPALVECNTTVYKTALNLKQLKK
jgi:hypothetical protein